MAFTHSITLGPQALRSGNFGFGMFPMPTYREASQGDWRVRLHLPGLGDGYLATTAMQARAVLSCGRTVWMSTGLLEQESHAWHVHCARGVVVTAGLGLGMYVYAAAMKPEVEQVVVVERSADVIALMRQASGFDHWPCRDKVRLLHADALAPSFAARVAQRTGGRPVDYLYADIWPKLPAVQAPTQTAQMVRALHPRAAGWWGQELSFAHWCRAWGFAMTLDNLDSYFEDVDVPAPPLTPGYLAFCLEAITANGLHRPPPLWQRLASWWRGGHSGGAATGLT